MSDKWTVSRVSERDGVTRLELRSGSGGVSVPAWVVPDGLVEGVEVDVDWHNGGGIGDRPKAVYFDGTQLCDISKEYLENEHKEFQAKYFMENHIRAFVNRDDWFRRKELLPKVLKDSMDSLVEKNGEEFIRDSYGYELFVREQAALVFRASQDPAWRAKVRATVPIPPANPKDNSFDWVPGEWTSDEIGPVEAIEAWWAVHNKINDYQYELQKELLPGWDDGHSGWTGSCAFSFARQMAEQNL